VQPLKIAIMAMGGEGGGVLADWIVDLGEANGHLAQTTSVPGVAQRTGATIYYVELYPAARAEADGAQPVLALMPLPGDVDVVLASELMEGGRAIQRGLVTPDRTTLLASTHRVYSITEKSALGDGRVDSDALLAHAAAAAKRFVRFDMAAVAEENGSVIGAVLFGALRRHRRAAVQAGPSSRQRSRAAASASPAACRPSPQPMPRCRPARSMRPRPRPSRCTATSWRSPRPPRLTARPKRTGRVGRLRSAARRREHAGRSDRPAGPRAARPDRARVSAVAAPMLKEGVRRLIDYQDPAYADLYLDRLAKIAAPAGADSRLLDETARHLALWMSYEDTIRVAALKTRGSRFDRVKHEVRAGRDQVLAIDEYLHPGVREIAETLPAAIGRASSGRGGCAARSSASPARAGSSPPARSAASHAACGGRDEALAPLDRRATPARTRRSRPGWRRSRPRPRPIPSSPSRWRSANAWSRATATPTSAACATSRR
jgi:indolepyruvate ferredoxin oxidoreductase beta subunit